MAMTLALLMRCDIPDDSEEGDQLGGVRTCTILGRWSSDESDEFWLTSVDPPIPFPSGSVRDVVIVWGRGVLINESSDGIALQKAPYTPYRWAYVADPEDPGSFAFNAAVATNAIDLPD